MTTMQTQWAWLLQLTMCVETHLKHASAYHLFFNEVQECEQWLARYSELLKGQYNQEDITLDQGERYLREMQEMRDNMARYEEAIRVLQARSQDIVPLPQRRQPLTGPRNVTALCTYKQVHVSEVHILRKN